MMPTWAGDWSDTMCDISIDLLLVLLCFLRLAFETPPVALTGQEREVESLPKRPSNRHTKPKFGQGTFSCPVRQRSQVPTENCGQIVLIEAALCSFEPFRQPPDYEIGLLPAQE